jgi:2-amino-4-hydroxy-6-hydroxymethyldihydropteridine diphosphokinase
MKSQRQVVLSIGTNQGNRLENIESCLQMIHLEVATVVKLSKVYETPSWGFESDAFYNVAIVVHTYDSAVEILSKILEIEQQMGRIREGNLGYQSRIIDIDIVAFDNEIIATEQLQVPHPLMHALKDEELVAAQ